MLVLLIPNQGWGFRDLFSFTICNVLLLETIKVAKAVPIFIFVSHPREGRFLAFQQEKKTKTVFIF